MVTDLVPARDFYQWQALPQPFTKLGVYRPPLVAAVTEIVRPYVEAFHKVLDCISLLAEIAIEKEAKEKEGQ